MGLRHERICHERSADYRHAAHVRALFYLLISVFVFVGCRGLRRRTSDRGLLRFAVGAFLVVSALGAVFAALVYIMAAPLAQPDMVDFYRMYRPGALIFLLGLFIIQFVFGVAAVYRGK